MFQRWLSFSGLVVVATLSVCLCSPPGNSSDVSLHQSEHHVTSSEHLSPLTVNVTRSRRQTVKSLPRIRPRHPRQIFGGGGGGAGGFVHLSGGQTFIPPPTLPPGQPKQMIQATRNILLDSIKVDLQSDSFGHQHRIEDGRGNFQFFQIGKRKQKPASSLNTNFVVPTIRPLQPIISPAQPKFIPTPVPSAPSVPSATPSSLASPAASESTAPVSVFVPPDTTLPVEISTTTLGASPTPATVSVTRGETLSRQPKTVTRLETQPRQSKALFSGTAVPVKELPRSSQSQPEQPAAFPFPATSNRFGFSPLQFPSNGQPFPQSSQPFPQNTNPLFSRPNQFLQGRQPPAFLRNPQSQSPTSGTPLKFFNQFPSVPSSMPSFGSNVFLGPPQNMRPMSQLPPLNLAPAFQRFPGSQAFRQVPKQFRPIPMPKPTLETRHLPEPRVISTSRPRVIATSPPQSNADNVSPTEGFRSQTSKTPLLSFNALKEIKAVRTTTKMTTTTPTTKSRTTTKKPKSSPSSQLSSDGSTPSFRMFAATMRPIRPTPQPAQQFVRFPSRRPQAGSNGSGPLHQVAPQTNHIQPNINNANNQHQQQTSLFAPIKSSSSVQQDTALIQTNNFRQNPGGGGAVSQPESLSMSDVRRVPAAQSNIPASHVNQVAHPDLLHVFTGSQPSDRTPPVFQVTATPAQSPSQSLPGQKPTQEATQLANDILSTLTEDQIHVLRQQLAVSLFPANNIQENFRFNSPTPVATTTTTQTTTTTKRPLNFRLKSRERMIHRNRARARNPNKIRLTTTASPRSAVKPNLFDPFTKNSNQVNNVNSNMKISQNFASHPQSVTSFSQEKLNAFANLLAVVNDDVDTTTKSSIASVSMGEGGFMAPVFDNDVETVTSNGLNQFEFFTPKSNFEGPTVSSTMLPAFDDNFNMDNFLLLTSTKAARVSTASGAPPTGQPVTRTRSPPSTPPFSSGLRTQETIPPFQTTIMDFEATEMTPIDDLQIFNFQPTPTGRKQRFKPTNQPRQFEFPTEAYESNEIDDFAPKFFVDPLMKEKFAIVKVKNHKVNDKSEQSTVPTVRAETPTTTPRVSAHKRKNLVTKTQQGPRKTLNRSTTGKRRKVKRIKGARKMRAQSKSSQNMRKRLPLIRRKSTATTSKVSHKSTAATPIATATTTTTTTATTTTTITSTATTTTATTTRRVRILNSGKIPETRVVSASVTPSTVLRQSAEESPEDPDSDSEDANARVLELTNNILELKAKLEKLKMELRI